MSDSAIHLSDEALGQIRQTVHDEALKARVAGSFLPLFGPLAADTRSVPMNRLEYPGSNTPGGPPMRMGVKDYENIRLTTLSVNVYLKSAQLADPELTSALIMFRRAADIMARVEDAIVFRGQEAVGKGPNDAPQSLKGVEDVFGISGGGDYHGLLHFGETENPVEAKTPDDGPSVFADVVHAIQLLEGNGHHGPFACVMGDQLFTAVTRPVPNSMVLPRDSILPFLDGPLLRSSTLPRNKAVIVALRGAPVEIVVPSDISVNYLQTTMDAEHVFRVRQKFVLRVKEPTAIATISGKTT